MFYNFTYHLWVGIPSLFFPVTLFLYFRIFIFSSIFLSLYQFPDDLLLKFVDIQNKSKGVKSLELIEVIPSNISSFYSYKYDHQYFLRLLEKLSTNSNFCNILIYRIRWPIFVDF